MPALLVASAAAVLLWLWGAALFLAARSAYRSGLLGRGSSSSSAVATTTIDHPDSDPKEERKEKQESSDRLFTPDRREAADGENKEPAIKVETMPVTVSD